jgi:multiple sugar transport system permease protein
LDDQTPVLATWAFFTGIQTGDLADDAAVSPSLFPV